MECSGCNIEMDCEEVGTGLYLIADKYTCPICGKEVIKNEREEY